MFNMIRRILFISQYLNRAGTEAFMMNVFRGIDHSRFQIDFLLYSWNETDYSREVEAAGCHVWRVPCRKESPLEWYRSVYKFFKEHSKDYVAIHYCGNGLTAIFPIVMAYHFRVFISESFTPITLHLWGTKIDSCMFFKEVLPRD